MATKQTTAWGQPPKAKPHPLLDKLAEELRGCHTSETYDVAGHKYTLRTLSTLEESWADGHVDGQNFYQAGRNRRAPYIAAALQAIDGVDVRELFQLPPDADTTAKEVYESAAEFMDDWRRGQVLRYIAENVQPDVLTELWGCYVELDQKRKEALGQIGPLSTRTSTGESGLTSSPAKAS